MGRRGCASQEATSPCAACTRAKLVEPMRLEPWVTTRPSHLGSVSWTCRGVWCGIGVRCRRAEAVSSRWLVVADTCRMRTTAADRAIRGSRRRQRPTAQTRDPPPPLCSPHSTREGRRSRVLRRAAPPPGWLGGRCTSQGSAPPLGTSGRTHRAGGRRRRARLRGGVEDGPILMRAVG